MKIFKRVLVILLISLMVLLAASFITLKQGINVSELSISNTQISNAHLIWDDRLKLEIESIVVQPTKEKSSKKSSTNPKPAYIRDALRAVNLIEEWFTSIDIKQIRMGSLKASFRYREREEGQLLLNSPQLDIQAKISADAEFLLVDIKNISSPEYKSHAEGKVRIDTNNRKLTATFEVMVADILRLQLEVKADRTQLSFSGHGKQSVTSIAPIVEVLDLGPHITPWISEYLTASQFSLSSVSGSIPYDKPASILQTLHAVASVKDTEYTFAQGLEPVKAKETEVTFEKGVLKIKPRNASFYQQDAGNSELDINFNNSPFILTAYIRTKAQASKGILTLLEYYGIPFPFEQKQGLVDTDLKLAINLSTIDIKSIGTFKTDNSVFEFDQQLIDVDHLDIGLNNTDIKLHKLDISKKDIFAARITGAVDTAKSQGDLHASIDDFSYQTAHSTLQLANPDNAPVKVVYLMRPDGDSVSVTASSWKAGDVHIDIGEFKTPFDLKTLSGKLPPTAVTISPWFKTKVSGTFNRKPPYANLDITLLDLTHDALRIEQPGVEMDLVIADDIRLKTKTPASLSMDTTAIKLLPTEITYSEKKLQLKHSGLELNEQLYSDIKGHLDFNTQKGSLTLDKLRIIDKTGMKILAVDRPLPVKLSLQENKKNAEIPMLGMKFEQHGEDAWTLSLNDFSKLHQHSPLMQRYKLQKGEISLTSNNGSLPYSFSGKVTYPDALLIDGDTPIHDYQLNGKYDGNSTTLDINEKVHITQAKKLNIDSNNVGYSLPALINLSKDTGEESDEKSAKKSTKKSKKVNAANDNGLSLSLNAKNSFIYLSENSRVLADELKVTVSQGVVDGDLKFGDGYASMQIKDNKLSLIGKKFNETFLDGLLIASKFNKGELEFQASGGLDNMDAVILINDAVIKKYGLLNNILAFINTVPALLTFRAPGYHRSGLHAREINAGINYQDGLIKLKTLHVDSKEIDLRGEGTANLNDNTIDITLNLITGSKKSMGHIPLLGYVLSGDKKKPSITLTMKGDLHDPKVSNTAFKEVATYPYQLLKRTIVLPVHLVKKANQNTVDNKIESRTTSD